MAETRKREGNAGIIKNGGAIIINDDGSMPFRIERALKALERAKSKGAVEGRTVDEAIADLRKAAASEPNLTICSTVPLPGLTTDLGKQPVKGPVSKFIIKDQQMDPAVVTDCGVESSEGQDVLVLFGNNDFTLTLLNGTMQEVSQSPYVYVMEGSGVVSSVHLGIKGSSKGKDYRRVRVEIHFPS